MTLHLVRHALSADRPSWTLDDRLRPLADAGTRQAHLLAQTTRLDSDVRVVSSPARRCIDTVAPLARRIGVEVETDELLYENNGAAALPSLRAALRAAPNATVVACTHGDVLPALLGALVEEDRLHLPEQLRLVEACTWVIEHDNQGRATAAEYRAVTTA
ncbi:MAG TPA: phosphoglycerate mutase family protein [Acidimicrobiales bacterium]|nr:phosphoglycerate mutase family protein [Acidimicrobiales bacterium]